EKWPSDGPARKSLPDLDFDPGHSVAVGARPKRARRPSSQRPWESSDHALRRRAAAKPPRPRRATGDGGGVEGSKARAEIWLTPMLPMVDTVPVEGSIDTR